MSVTQQIKDRLDIVQYVQQFAPDLKKAGRYYKACCPFHGEKTPSFVVNPDTQSWRCFGACAEGGDILTFAQKRHGWSFAETLKELGRLAGVEVHERSADQQNQDARLDRLRGILQTAADYYHQHLLSNDSQAQTVLQYAMQKRGFTLETLRAWGIGYAPASWSALLESLEMLGFARDDLLDLGLVKQNDKGRVYDAFRNRLMIPIRDERGRVIGFGARALAPDDNPKYLNSPQSSLFDKSQTLFGLDKAKTTIREQETVVIVEGYMDAIQAHQAGYTNVVAQMGTALTESQLKLLSPRYAKKIIMALDADEAGQNATRRSLEVARQALQNDYMGKLQVDIRVLHIDDAKDPDDVLRETPEKWAGYVQTAMPVADFVIQMETADLSPQASFTEKQALATRILAILTASENNFYTQENLQKLALRLHLNERDLLDWARTLREQEKAKKARSTSYQPITPPPVAPSQSDEPPPFFDENGFSSSSEEPPPFFGELDTPSAEAEFLPRQVSKVAAPAPSLSRSNTSRETEKYCLQMLLRQPDTWALINRKFRELAGENESLQTGALREFCAEDFSQGDFRALVDALESALAQDDAEPLDFLQESLEPQLIQELEALMLAEDEGIYRKIGQRLSAEFEQIWQHFERNLKNGYDFQADVIKRALKVRHQRLEREQEEIRFLLTEAQQHQDSEAATLYYRQTVPLMQALRLIQKALG